MASMRLYGVVAGAVVANLAVLLQVSPGRAAWGWQMTPDAAFTCAEGTVGCPAQGSSGFDACIANETSYDCTVQSTDSAKTCDVDKIKIQCTADDASFTGAIPDKVMCINVGMNNSTTGEVIHAKNAKIHWSQDPVCAPNIVGLAQSVTDLSTLVAAVTAADLVDTLSDASKSYTVFAPTNDAFAAIQSTVDDLLKPENKAQLVSVLTFHVLDTRILSTELAASQTPSTVQGQSITVTKDSSGVKVSADGSTVYDVTMADQLASNGVVHIINGVLVPSLSASDQMSGPNAPTPAADETPETSSAVFTSLAPGLIGMWTLLL